MKKQKYLIIISSIISTALIFLAVTRVYAQSAGISTYFGALHLVTLPCTCSDASNDVVIVYDFGTKRELNLLYEPGQSRLYIYDDIWASRYLLGSYSQGGECEILVADDCVTVNIDGTLNSLPGTGTST